MKYSNTKHLYTSSLICLFVLYNLQLVLDSHNLYAFPKHYPNYVYPLEERLLIQVSMFLYIYIQDRVLLTANMG